MVGFRKPRPDDISGILAPKGLNTVITDKNLLSVPVSRQPIRTQTLQEIDTILKVPLAKESFTPQEMKGAFNDKNNHLIIANPINISLFSQFLKIVRDNAHTLDIVVGVENNGHIITHLIPKEPNTPILAFDSTATDLKSFYSKEPQSRFKKLSSFFSRLITSLHPWPKKNFNFENNHTLQYRSTGTQSIFDTRTSYFHHTSHLLQLQKKLNEVRTPGDINIDTPLSGDSIFTSAVLQHSHTHLGYKNFIKTAWSDTFLPNLEEDQQDKLTFNHYFLGWPAKQTPGKIIFYWLSFSFITTPLINVIKAVTQFPFNLLSETANYLRHQFMAMTFTTPVAQYLRSLSILFTMAIQSLFKGAVLLINTVTSPIDSMEQAWKIHPILGGFSALISLTAIAAIAVFATPLLIHALPSITPTLLNASHVITASVAKIPLLSTLASASALIASAVVLLKGVKAIFNRFLDTGTLSSRKTKPSKSSDQAVHSHETGNKYEHRANPLFVPEGAPQSGRFSSPSSSHVPISAQLSIAPGVRRPSELSHPEGADDEEDYMDADNYSDTSSEVPSGYLTVETNPAGAAQGGGAPGIDP